MGKTRSVKGCRTARGFTRAIKSQGGSVEHGRKHLVARPSSGAGKVAIPRHSGDLNPRTGKRISLLLLGLGFSIFVCLPVGLVVQVIFGLKEMYS